MAREFLVRPFELKNDVDEEKGTFEGYGSVFGGEKDSYKKEYWGDIVEKGAFKKTIKKGGRNRSSIAMLYQHNPEQVPGVWTQIVEDDNGLKVVGQLAMNTQLGKESFELLKMKAIGGLSIGFDTVKTKVDEETRTRYLEEVELWEISLVTFPRKIDAGVRSVKAIEESKNIRELESVLRDVGGLSFHAAKTVISKVKEHLRDVEEKNTFAIDPVLQALQSINSQISIEREFRNCHV